jgi:hypothetical protein
VIGRVSVREAATGGWGQGSLRMGEAIGGLCLVEPRVLSSITRGREVVKPNSSSFLCKVSSISRIGGHWVPEGASVMRQRVRSWLATESRLRAGAITRVPIESRSPAPSPGPTPSDPSNRVYGPYHILEHPAWLLLLLFSAPVAPGVWDVAKQNKYTGLLLSLLFVMGDAMGDPAVSAVSR